MSEKTLRNPSDRSRNRTLMMCMCAMFTALIAIGAFIKIPVPVVPFTLQYEFTMLAGLLLGRKYGTVSVVLYVLVGLCGAPVFTQGGGLWYVMVPSFGYLIGFIPGTYVTGLIAHRNENPSMKRILAANFAGLAIVYTIGMAYVYIIKNFFLEGDGIRFWPLLLNCFILAVPGDIVLCIIAALAAKKIIPVTAKYRI